MSVAPSCYTIGEAKITRIFELPLDSFTPDALFGNWDAAIAREHPEWFSAAAMRADNLLLSVHGWLIEDGKRTILVDTGVGSGKPRPFAPYFDKLTTPFLENLARAGVAPEAVDIVLSTHLHVDHVGWNTRLEEDRWVPTFARARHVFSRAEHAYFTDETNLTDATRTSFQVQADSVDPIIAAGLADPIAIDGGSPIEGFAFHPTPGHSPDHASISFASNGAIGFFPGDVFHHPVEIGRPDLMTIFDRDAERVRASRDWAFAFAADHDAIVFSSHAPASSVGRISRRDDGYDWRFL